MKKMPSKKSHSWWWNSHISPKNSKWLAENLEEMDHRVKEMLKLIEEEGDSFAMKAEMYYKKRPELISHVEDFYRMYRALAERYDHVTGELRKSIPSDLQSQGSGGGSDIGSEPPSPSQLPSPEHTPDRKLPRPKPSPRAAGFDFFLGSGGSSDPSRREGDGSSSSDSESGSDDSKNDDGDSSDGLHRRIFELESELQEVKDKLHEHEEKCLHGPSEGMENGEQERPERKIRDLEKELVDINEKLWVSEKEIFRLNEELESHAQSYDELRLSKEQTTAELEERIVRLEFEISGREHELEDLKTKHAAIVEQLKDDVSGLEEVIAEFKMEAANQRNNSVQEKLHFENVITAREHEIEELKAAIECVSEEKSLLLSRVSEQEHAIEGLRAEAHEATDQSAKEKLQLEAEICSLSESHFALKAKLEVLEALTSQLLAEKADLCATGSRRVEELNHELDDLKRQLDMLTAERDGLSARVHVLTDDVMSRESQLSQMEGHLQKLHMEHVSLISEAEEARRASREQRERVKELEEEVDRQTAVACDAAEGKREAIRQLCFSLEHYRDGYCRLRHVLQGTSKRPPSAVLAS